TRPRACPWPEIPASMSAVIPMARICPTTSTLRPSRPTRSRVRRCSIPPDRRSTASAEATVSAALAAIHGIEAMDRSDHQVLREKHGMALIKGGRDMLERRIVHALAFNHHEEFERLLELLRRRGELTLVASNDDTPSSVA